jgi:hypothetical protein
MKHQPAPGTLGLLPIMLSAAVFVPAVSGQETTNQNESQMTLRKSAEARDYKGRPVEGESRLIEPGDSLWRILIQEKGLPEKKFSQYVIVIRGLNPHMKSANVLKIGDTLFIPMRPDEAFGAKATSPAKAAVQPSETFGKGSITNYRVRRGNHLYQILREQLGITDEKELALYYALVKDLNPQRKEWDVLLEGEIIRLPTTGDSRGKPTVTAEYKPVSPLGAEKSAQTAQVTMVAPPEKTPAPQAPQQPITLDFAQRLPAQANLPLLEEILNKLGTEVQTEGQEIFALNEGTIRLDKGSYPVVYDPKLQQKVIIDAGQQIPTSLRKNLDSPYAGTSVLSLPKSASLQEAVGQLLLRLGYQALPSDRSIIVQEDGVAFEAKGTWMALAPQESNKAQDIFVITLTDKAGEIPEYLREQLSAKGVHLKDVVLPSSFSNSAPPVDEPENFTAEVKTWPREKSELVDALLLAYGIPFGVAETHFVELGEGLRLEARSDRVFDSKGQRICLFFQPIEPVIKKALQEHQSMRIVEIDLASLSRKQIIGRILEELGDKAVYKEHKFPASNGNESRLYISTSGFWLRHRALFLTDRQIPPALHRFFFEKGLEIVYFQ